MSNPAENWSSGKDDGSKDDNPSEKPSQSKLTGKWKIPDAATTPASSTLSPSDNDQNPGTADRDSTGVDSETQRQTGELAAKIATATINDQEITPSMGLNRSKDPVEGETLKNRLRMAERLDRK